jgi:pantoate--beta-alanine ligase
MVATSALSILRQVAALRAQVGMYRSAGETVALVPTMGALHEGHLTLVREARKLCRRVIATIFVNPTQFDSAEDPGSYPRDEENDIAKLGKVGADAVFMPSVEEMYPPGASTQVTITSITEGLCGAYRPGHFSGVATVVTKLLLQSLPDVALFGEKDYQQLQVVRRLVRDLDIPARIEGVATVREPDGLALSSRNVQLTACERRVAPMLYRVLTRIARALAEGKEARPLLEAGRIELLAAGFDPVQYLELCDAETLAPLACTARPGRLLVAAYLGKTRLIDNVAVVPRR